MDRKTKNHSMNLLENLKEEIIRSDWITKFEEVEEKWIKKK